MVMVAQFFDSQCIVEVLIYFRDEYTYNTMQYCTVQYLA